jgi:DNA-binding FadR family transcriptional regulator
VRSDHEADLKASTDAESQPAGHVPLADLFANDPVSAALADILRRVGPGARLPSERDLAAQLSVSRTALRDRLGMLEGIGVLRRRSGSGTYVEPLQPQVLTVALSLGISSSDLPLNALESVRIALERQAAREAALRAEPVLIAHMRRAVDTMATGDGDAELFAADRVFHQSLLRAAGNPALTFFADSLAGLLERDLAERIRQLHVAMGQEPLRRLLVDAHSAIYDAVLGGDQVAAMQTIDAHFDAFLISGDGSAT